MDLSWHALISVLQV